jgi:peptidoglycan/xylan/chitin deacetylase (PgdA/CDA1 family)
VAVAAIATGCGFERLDRIDEIFSQPGDGRRVLCATGLDTVAGNDLDSIHAGLDRAAARGEVIHLYGHSPGKTAPLDKIEAVVTDAAARGLTFVTYADLIDGSPVPGGGIALSFDDTDVDAWYGLRDLFARVGARATFFLSRYDGIDADRKARLRQLFDDGNAIEAHTVRHQHGPDYVEQYGLRAYLRDEAMPSIDRLRADGYPVRAYAYPFGARTGELDRALLDHVEVLRAVTFTTQTPLASDPCPE